MLLIARGFFFFFLVAHLQFDPTIIVNAHLICYLDDRTVQLLASLAGPARCARFVWREARSEQLTSSFGM